jgi:glucose-6-phosphate dehydrogenase, NAD binding domain
MVIFGVTGDLARKKLLPAIYDLANRGLLPAGFTLVGYGRRDWSKADFEDYIKEAVKAGARTPFRDNVWERLAEGMVFVSGNFDDDAAFDQLAATLSELDQTRGTAGNWGVLPVGSARLFFERVPSITAFRHGPGCGAGMAAGDCGEAVWSGSADRKRIE